MLSFADLDDSVLGGPSPKITPRVVKEEPNPLHKWERLAEEAVRLREARALKEAEAEDRRRLAAEAEPKRRGRQRGFGQGYSSHLLFNLKPETLARIEKASVEAGISRSEWVRRAVEKALTETP